MAFSCPQNYDSLHQYINEWTVKNAYPLPLIPLIIAKLRDAKYFTKVDV
jgi:hypothetical protein